MKLFASSLVAVLVAYLSLAFQVSPPSTLGDTGVLPDTSLAALIAEGAVIYARTCERCHNARGPAERTDREWVIIMQHMQTRANLTRAQAILVRAFLLASNEAAQAPGRLRPDVPAVTDTSITDAAIAQGRVLYHSAGTCFACHGQQLEGTSLAPNLNDATWKNGTGDYASILRIVRNGVPGTAMAAYPGGISDEQARQAAAYVWAVAHNKIVP